MRLSLRERVAGGPPLLLDGAVGTELNRRGVRTDLPLWSSWALLEAPDVLDSIHRDYVVAGAELLTANTFRTHRRSLERAGMGNRAAELTGLAVEIARAAASGAAGSGAGPAWVAGSVAPLEDCYEPDLVPPDESLRREHGEIVSHLVDAGVDLLLVETMNTIREAIAAAEAAVATGVPTFVGLVCGRDARLLSGESLAEAARELSRIGPDLLMVNCTPTPDLYLSLQELASNTDLPLGAYGNVGYADEVQGWVNTDSVEPAVYARHAERWLGVGLRLLGSCCGTGPAHTAELRHLLERTGA